MRLLVVGAGGVGSAIVSIAARRAIFEQIVVAEASPGQLEDELRLALSHAGIAPPPIASVRRLGGNLPQQAEILARIRETQEACV